MAIIKAGSNGNVMDVDAKLRAQTKSVMSTVEEEAISVGDGYNLNTGLISLTTSTASGVMYIKNNETKNLIIKTIVPFIGNLVIMLFVWWGLGGMIQWGYTRYKKSDI